MNTSFKKASAVGLCACLALTSLAGCSKKEEEETFDAAAAAVTVNGTELSAGLVNFATRYSQSLVEGFYSSFTGSEDPFNVDLYGNGSTLGSMMRDDIVTDLTEMALAEQKMEEYSVELTDEEKSAITAAAAEFIEANEEEVLAEISGTQEIVERYLELKTVQTKVQEAMSADVDTEVSDEEAAQRRVQYTMFTPSTETEEETETEEAAEEEETAAGTEAGTAQEETAAETALEEETAPETEAETASLTEEETVKSQAAAETEKLTEEAAAETEAVEETAEEASADAEAAETEESTEAEDSTEAETGESTEAEDSTEAPTEEETETETEDPAMVEARAKAKAQAQEMLDNIKGGMEFEEAAEAAGKAANEMTFGVGDEETRAELMAATDGLEDGTLVDEVVETDNGFYVVKLISQIDREATDAEKESIVEERKNERIEELYTEWKEASEISQDDEVLATVAFDFSLSQYVETETEAADEDSTEAASENSTEDSSEDGTEAETEAASEDSAETETETAGEDSAETETETASAETETEAAAE